MLNFICIFETCFLLKFSHSQHLSLTCKIHQLEASTPLSSFGWIYVRFGEETCRKMETRGTAGFLLSGGHNSAKRHLHSRVGHVLINMKDMLIKFFMKFASLDFGDKTNQMRHEFQKSRLLKLRSIFGDCPDAQHFTEGNAVEVA